MNVSYAAAGSVPLVMSTVGAPVGSSGALGRQYVTEAAICDSPPQLLVGHVCDFLMSWHSSSSRGVEHDFASDVCLWRGR